MTIGPQPPGKTIVRLVWSGTWFLVLTGVAAAVIRMSRLASGARTGSNPRFDAGFAQHPVLTLIHILPGALFLIFGALQFSRRLRMRAPKFHRWSGRALVILGLVIGLSAFAMSFQMAIGGVNEIAATVLFDLLFLFFLIRGFVAARKRDFVHHREWMIRMFGVGLGIATVRPIMGVFFAASRLTHMTPHEFFGIAFWIGFTITLIAAESWINYTRDVSRGRHFSRAAIEASDTVYGLRS
jgi:uncharacterized membrane protein